jgi:hypothetical protein
MLWERANKANEIQRKVACFHWEAYTLLNQRGWSILTATGVLQGPLYQRVNLGLFIAPKFAHPTYPLAPKSHLSVHPLKEEFP